MAKRMLVLGGAGYIGSHAVYALLEQGYDAAVADNLSTGFRAAVHPDARFYEGDIRDRAFLDAVLARERPDAVIHFAASSLVGESMRDPLKYYENNLAGTMALLRAMLAHGLDALVFSSSAAVYGEPDAIPIPEEAPARPTNCYGETKRAMEQLIRWVGEAHGLRALALRYFNAAGAHASAAIGEAHDPETHLIPLVLRAAAQEQPLSVFGADYPTRDGTCERDYIHVMDLARAHILAAEYLIAGGASDTLNLGTGTGCTVREILAAAEAVVGRPIPHQAAPRRPGDPARLVAAGAKAEAMLGWQPRESGLMEILASAWEWHRTHPHGFET